MVQLGKVRPKGVDVQADLLEIHVPGFQSIVEKFAHDKKTKILDLSSPTTDNLAFFSHWPCKLFFENIHETFAVEQDFLQAVAADANIKFDVILCWDILQHLSHPQIQALTNLLVAYSSSHTLIHALIDTQHPVARDGKYTIQDSAHLNVRFQPTISPPHQPLHQAELRKCMPELEVLKAVLLKDGIQEFVLHPAPKLLD